jgi:hypothetical protein
MTWFDHSRRAASVLLVVLCLLAIPAVADATFSGSRSAGLGTGTDRMETPASIAGTYRCSRSGSTESISVTVTTFADDGPTGSSYGFGLALGTATKDTAYSTSKSATLDGSRTYDAASTTWTVGIQSFLERWTSELGTDTIVCPANGTRTGTF